MMALIVAGISGTIPTSEADQVRTIRTQSEMNVDWASVRGAVAISATRKVKQGAGETTAPFLSTAVMIDPTIGFTTAHSLEGTLEAWIVDDQVVTPASRKLKVRAKAVHPDYKGNNFSGIDFAVFQLEQPLHLDRYFKPVALPIESLKGEILQRIGFGERDEENRRTWVLENYNRRLTGEHYLTSVDQFGYPGDSGGPVYRTGQGEPELVGIHVGRMLDPQGKPLNESNTLVLTPELLDWVNTTTTQWLNPALKPSAPSVSPARSPVPPSSSL